MEKILKLNSNEEAIALYGTLDETLRHAEKEYRVRVSARNHRLKIVGTKKDVDAAHRFFTKQLAEIRKKAEAGPASARGTSRPREQQQRSEPAVSGYQGMHHPGSFFHRGKSIHPKSKNQAHYLDAIASNDIVVAIGPAGTGKTYLAMAAAIDQLKKKHVARIILTRPAVEAGENLGFLPGDLQDKVNPYLRPLYDALYDMMDYEDATRCIERGIIEVAPLAYMRGRTLSDAFIILDEGQNCTHAQMKMFLTRLGQFSKTIVTGDITQIDLPGGKKSGLVEAQKILTGIKGVGMVYLTDVDVVRHPLVQKIILAYEKYESGKV